jgi:hypothetical protein
VRTWRISSLEDADALGINEAFDPSLQSDSIFENCDNGKVVIFSNDKNLDENFEFSNSKSSKLLSSDGEKGRSISNTGDKRCDLSTYSDNGSDSVTDDVISVDSDVTVMTVLQVEL